MNNLNALKGLRGIRNMSQKELATKAGMRQPEISHLENGLKPTERQLKKITKAFELRESTD